MGQDDNKRMIVLTLAYDGTDFFGFQSQAGTGLPTVQDALEAGIAALSGERVTVEGSGRTDTGVHAWGQVVHFYTSASIPPERWALALPPHLPESIVVRESKAADSAFHARFSAKRKTYLYQFYCHPTPSPFLRRYACHVPYPLDVTAMEKAASYFEGSHDFRGFCAAGAKVNSFVREISLCRLHHQKTHRQGIKKPGFFEAPGSEGLREPEEMNVDFAAFAGSDDALLRLEIQGNGFLWHMVRIIAGTLLEVGAGKRKPQDIPLLLGLGNRCKAGKTLPPQGLFLYGVEYPKVD